jgi:hypothetical protein
VTGAIFKPCLTPAGSSAQTFGLMRMAPLFFVQGFGDSEKTVYFAVMIENDGKKGHWGPMTSALIP